MRIGQSSDIHQLVEGRDLIIGGVKIPYEIGARRDRDLPEFWADSAKAERVLGWKAKRGLDEMCEDSWNWQKKNPDGYGK